ncbi:MAG: pseudouridine synthase [Candidatus Saccharimonadaceae bacterium]|nr:pseudouridine synthase [Candidatus Saccharimonadaceae bacterium]
MSQPQPIRLNKFLAERLGLSRREADEIISAGKVKIDGQTAQLGARVDFSNKVWYNGNIIPFDTDYLYIAFNKPVGYVCSRRAQGSTPTIYDLLPAKYRQLKTVGRLDKDSSGLIILTNDGDFAYQMTHPKFHKEKIYEVELDRSLEPLHQQMISDYGVMLDDGPSRFAIVRNASPTSLSKGVRRLANRGVACEPRGDGSERRAPRKMVSEARYTVVLSEGRNRQIRRTFAALGYRVTALHRTQFGPYQLASLAPGKCEPVTKV